MKKYLPVFAVLVLGGCAYSEYRASYIEEYAGYDCYQLRTERLAVEAELGPKWVEGLAADNTMSTALFFSDAGAGPGFGMEVLKTRQPRDDFDPTRPEPHKKRLQNHARWQALAQLEQSKGCHQDVSSPPELHE